MAAILVQSFESFANSLAQVTWPTLKDVIAAHQPVLLYSEDAKFYRVVTTSVNGVQFQAWCEKGTPDAVDFGANYKG